jgi:hypothetical protein
LPLVRSKQLSAAELYLGETRKNWPGTKDLRQQGSHKSQIALEELRNRPAKRKTKAYLDLRDVVLHSCDGNQACPMRSLALLRSWRYTGLRPQKK